MGKKLTKYDAHHYVLSCGHAPMTLFGRIANTCHCTPCNARVFILAVKYERNPDDD